MLTFVMAHMSEFHGEMEISIDIIIISNKYDFLVHKDSVVVELILLIYRCSYVFNTVCRP